LESKSPRPTGFHFDPVEESQAPFAQRAARQLKPAPAAGRRRFVAEKRDNKHSNRCEDRAENLSAVNLRPAERAEQTGYQQRNPNSKEQKDSPREIAA
jgi:hypothetical protein